MIMQLIPVTLSGNTLGERHRNLNALVNDASESSIPFPTIQALPEASPIDRLFKIELASKHRDVNYIIQNLKDADLLYVARALKCTWLLDPQYEALINPKHLEEELYPEMVTPAVTKMKHWIHIHLKDSHKCQSFYKYYKDTEFEYAVKFLRNSSNKFLLEEFDSIMTRIKPRQLKVLSEKCPQLTKKFYERLEGDKNLVKHYLANELDFLSNLKYVLKSDPDTFFYVVEKYYNIQRNRYFRPQITENIMVHHKDKFLQKPELYTVFLLDMKTLAKCLNRQEANDLVIQLAHAAYLDNWFTYKSVEPLILRLNKDERVILKKKVFVNKDLGDKITDWSYKLPTSPILEKEHGYSLFTDRDQYDYSTPDDYVLDDLCEMECLDEGFIDFEECRVKQKTLLDELFDHYRFVSFENTFFELRTRLRAESSPQNRRYMMLVLVSKCGGREKAIKTLFGLLAEYRNEPVHLRAAIIRSLVKRAFVWRLPEDLWRNLLEWGHGLGLDGTEPEAACDEGLHAVVLRDLLANQTSTAPVLSRFFSLFTNFTHYSLTVAERSCVRTRLPTLLMSAAENETGFEKCNRFNQVLDTLQAFKVLFTEFPCVITAIADAARDSPDDYSYILNRLYHARAGRRQLFKVNFLRYQNDASYVNALRHDIAVLNAEMFKDLYVAAKASYRPHMQFDRFLRKLVVYFSEDDGLAKKFYSALEYEAKIMLHKLLARPLALLAGNNLSTLLKNFDSNTKRRPKTPGQSLAAALRANAHTSRPALDLNVIGWQAAGVKAVANVVSISPKKNRKEIITKLTAWKQALRLALVLTEDKDSKCNIFKALATTKPNKAVKLFLHGLNNKNNTDELLGIWNEVKPIIEKLENKTEKRLLQKLISVSVPDVIKKEYYLLVYKVILNWDIRRAFPLLCKIENICYEVDETFLYETLKIFLENDFKKENICVEYYDIYYNTKCFLHIRLIAKFLLLCTSEEIQKKRLEVVGELFFARIETIWEDPANRKHLERLLLEFLTSLKYNKVIFDVKYVSCMPVFERILNWMQSFLSIEEWFDAYVDIKLTMLYHKAARCCLADKPEYFHSDPSNLDKGVEMFGTVFGKLVAHEIEELKSKYFQSFIQIYRKEIIDYFVTSLDYQTFDESKERFAIAFVKSILLETDAKAAHLVALHVFQEHVMFYFEHNYDLSEVMCILKDTNDSELKFNFEMMLTDDTERCNKIKI